MTASSEVNREVDDRDGQDALRSALHALVDAALDRRPLDRPWRPLERRQQQAFNQPLPQTPALPQTLVETLRDHGLLDPAFASHPRFFGWVLGSGRPEGKLGAVAAALTNVNAFGGAQISTVVERQVLDWTRAALELDAFSDGILVSGSSEANLLALAAAREEACGDSRVGVAPGARVLISGGAHHSVARASRLLGLGAPFIVGGPGDETFDAEVLDHRLRREASEGRRIAAIVATAGSARTGAFDDMVELAAVAKAHSVWLHVDGAFGAWARLLPDSARVRGLELAHSVALDYHKAIHAPYATGAVLVRRRGALQRALAEPSDYLSGFPGGFGGLKDWPGERSLATSRGFGALGVWATWAGAGHGALKAGVEQSYTLAQELEERLRRAGWLTAPVHGPIVAFGPPSREGLGWSSPRPAQKIVTELQHRGEAVITPVRLGGRWALRACTLGLGTTLVDIDALVNFLSELYSVGPQR